MFNGKIEISDRNKYILDTRLWDLKFKHRHEQTLEDNGEKQDIEDMDNFNKLYGLRMLKNVKKFNQYKAL